MHRQLDSVVGTSLLGAVGLAEAFLDQIAQNATDDALFSRNQALQAIRAGVQAFEPLLAEHLSDSVLSGWITGYDNVAAQFPPWLQREFSDSIRRGPPNDPPVFNLFGMFEREPKLRLVNVENAAKRLMERGILTRPQFDEASEQAQRQAFTIAGGLGTDTIDRMRFMLNKELNEGPSLRGYTNRITELLDTSPIGPGHLENVYRTNLQAAYRDGRETLRSNPIVAATFPYQAYIAVHDARARHNHRELETLGMNGTNIYRADDPFWDYFTPPWDYNCRCGVQMLTLEQAAARGVKEAQEWLRTGRAPIHPEYRYSQIPFEHNEGFGHRGNVGIIVMSAARAPSGYSKDAPLVINGKEYVGGMFIPGDEIQHATAEQKKEIESGKKVTPTPQAPKHVGHEPPTHWVSTIATKHALKLKSGYSTKLLWDTKASSRGWYFQISGPDGKQSFADRYANAQDAAKHAATLLHVRGLAKPTEAKQAKPSTFTPEKPPRQKREVKTNQGNWHYPNTDFVSRGAKTKFHDNLAALRTLKTLDIEQRSATEAEKEILSRFVGWGQFPQAFDYRKDYSEYEKWSKERDELKDLVGEDGFASARQSTINSHYTAPDVIEAHWKMAEKLGFKGGKYLEPAVGGGYYIGLMPEHLAEKTNVTAVEMDTTAGAISKELYPSANVHITPFQDHATPNNFFDLVATNVPFSGEVRIYDPKYKTMKPTLHDYYFLRSVDTAKPGGLIMHITSAGTMDKLDGRVRKYIDDNCELVSAIRFPGDTHKANAGTEVVTDMLILRKKNPTIPDVTDETPTEANPEHHRFTGTTVDSLGRIYHWVDGVRVPGPKWDDTVQVPDPDGGDPITINRYFAEHPEQMLGKLDRSGTMYSGKQKNVVKTEDYDALLQSAIDRLPSDILRTGNQSQEPEESRVMVQPGRHYLDGQLINQDGKIYQHKDGALELQNFDKPTSERILGQIAIRDAARELLAAQRSGGDTMEVRERLNVLYDQYVAKHGLLHDRKNRAAVKLDPDAPFLLSLEHYNSTTKKANKADLFSQDTVVPDFRAEKAGSIPEAVGITLHESGTVDIDRIAELTGKSTEEIGEELVSSGMAFENPASGWQSASEYLSGNTRQKLLEAKAAAAADPRYEPNVAALEKSQPVDIEPEEIGVKLGSPWVPTDVIQQFAAETLGADPDDISIKYTKELQDWRVDLKSHLGYRQSNLSVWGVKNDADETVFSFEDALRSALHGKQPVIRSAMSDEDGNRRVLTEATNEALQKIDELKAQFKDWVWSDPARAESLARLYNDTQNNYVPRHFDGSHQSFPGMNANFKMRQLQKDFVWRVVTTGKGLAAHEVGTGKTASMIASAMELRRLGLAKKPTIACLKSNIEQITKEALELYPDAKILSTANNFDAANRRKTLHQIATGDYDLIIMTHDHMEAMKMKPETLTKFIQEEVDELEDAIQAANADDSGDTKVRKSIVKSLENKKLKLQERLKDALSEASKDQVFFEDSGIDQLFVDEAHHFKSLPCYSREQLKGVPTGRSDRATDMLAKTRYILDNNNGRGVVFATGTPIVNTMAELYVMQRYLQPDALKERGLHHFDNWKDTYGETRTDFEFKLNGDVAQTQRFSQFVNLPELRHLSSEFMDIQRADNLKLPDGRPAIVRPNKHDQVIVSEPNEAVDAMMLDIQHRAEALKGKRPGGKGEDNMLNVCNDARLGSIDMRLIDPDAPDHPESKANRAIREVVQLYHEHPGTTQCVFSDLGINPTKASGFSLFSDMKQKLVDAGIPREHIVDFSDDSMKDAKRQDAQDAMKRGDVRIAFGSTKRLGTGTNIQKNLYAVHHLDIPYIPAALEQRDGRGYRSGNQNEDFHVYKYVQQGSADPLFWQILARKTGFINQYMLGDSAARTMEDINAESLTPDEMINVASGGSDAMERIKVEQEVSKLQRSKMRHSVDQTRIAKALSEADDHRATLRQAHENRTKDHEHFQANDEWRMDIGGRAFTERKDAEPVLAEAIAKGKATLASTPSWHRSPVKIATYRGADLLLKPDGMFALEGPSGDQYESGTAIASIDYAARALAKRVEHSKTAIENYETDLVKMKAQVGNFRKQQELERALARLEEMKGERNAAMVAADKRELIGKG